MRPEIAIDASRASGTVRTGTEWYSYELIKAMIALHERPELLLYQRDISHSFSSAPRVRNRVLRTPRLWTHIGLSAAIVRDRPRGLFVPSHVIPAIHPRASVVTIHDLGYVYEPAAHARRSRLLLDLTTRWNAAVARQIIAISGQTRDDLIRRYRTRPEKIRVIHSGVDHERFQPMNRAAAWQITGLTQPYVLFLSTVQPRKNLLRLLDAFIALDDPERQLVIAGKTGWLSGDIEARILGATAYSNINRLGYVADGMIPALYAGADAFVLPSLYEGFGLGVLEAMASGCPVVVSDTSSLPEVAGEAAIRVDPHDVASIRDGLRRALNREERRRLRAAGLERAAEFTWERTARETLALILDATRHGQ